MKLRLMIFACCFTVLGWISLLTAAQSQDNAAVCHTPNATKAATKQARLMEGYGRLHMPVTTKSEEA